MRDLFNTLLSVSDIVELNLLLQTHETLSAIRRGLNNIHSNKIY
jgi:hypothetical protein